MRVRLWTSLIVLLTLSLAGCTSADEPATDLSSTADAKRGGGAVEGAVTDDEQFPVAGAIVNVLSRDDPTQTPITLTTNSTGAFAARGLASGGYTVLATKEGYEDPEPKVVSVVEGVTVTATFELVPLAPLEPYHESVVYTNEFLAEICVFTPVPDAERECQSAFDPSNLTIQLEIEDSERIPWAGFVVEVDWTPNVDTCSKGFQTHLFSPDQEGLDTTFPTSNSHLWADDNPYHWDNVPEATAPPTFLRVVRDGPDPTAVRSDARTQLNGGDPVRINGVWTLQTWAYNQGALGTPADVGCTVSQPIDIWYSTFWLDGPSQAFTALA